MTLTPREAITHGQVWLRQFGHFEPEHQGYMGFSRPGRRASMLSRMEDGALVFIWGHSREAAKDWQGRFMGVLQLRKAVADADSVSTSHGKRLREDSANEFHEAIPAMRAWVALPTGRVRMKLVLPDSWTKARSIGQNSAQATQREISLFEDLRIAEVPVLAPASAGVGPFKSVSDLFR
ncbi:hypothetical protein [Thioclava sp. GXIMD4215]|uniref:hypothetical protein n=1 Tax=Thioclava sp. GXIMD4215 TaxID=3131928 RepID=UPI00311AFCEE